MPKINDYFQIEPLLNWTTSKVRRNSLFIFPLLAILTWLYSQHLITPLFLTLVFIIRPSWGVFLFQRLEKMVLIFIHLLNLLALATVFYTVLNIVGIWVKKKDLLKTKWPPDEKTFRQESEPLRPGYFNQPY